MAIPLVVTIIINCVNIYSIVYKGGSGQAAVVSYYGMSKSPPAPRLGPKTGIAIPGWGEREEG